MLKLAALVMMVAAVEGGNVLAILPLPGRSHHLMFQSVLEALSSAGHDVTAYTPFPPVNVSYSQVQIDSVMEFGGDVMARFFLDMMDSPYRYCYDRAFTISDPMFYTTFKDKAILKLIESKPQFDLIITEQLAGQEFISIFSHIFQAPAIRIQAFVTNSVLNSVSGNSLSMSFIPDFCSPHPNKMSFTERLLNSFYVLRQLYHYHYRYLPDLESKMRILFPEMPPLLDLIQNVSLTFVNDHLTVDYAQPRTPNIIPVGGIHIQPTQPLPKHIQRFMDDAEEGVILFSMGTLTPEHLQTQQYFVTCARVFRGLRQRVLWKTRRADLPTLQDNVLISDWLPQQDILAHPKCVLFVTHGGQHSLLEAIHFAVPVVVIPQFFDQHRTARFCEDRGVGVRIGEDDFSEKSISQAIQKVLEEPRYKQNMQRLSRIFRDTPQSPSQSVVYWTGHVMRHGFTHLRPASTRLPAYQLALLDVLAAALSTTLAILTLVYLAATRLWRVSTLAPGIEMIFEYNSRD